MPGKEIRLIKKTLHADGYYYYTATSEAATILTPKRPRIKISFRFDKGLITGSPEQRDEKLKEEEEEQAAAVAREEIPTPGFVLVKEEVEDDHYTSSMASTTLFQSKLVATKRKMYGSYQQLANAKKQRRIQVVDPRDLPPPPTQSSSKGKGGAVPARKKMTIITTNRKTRNFFDGRGGQSKLVKPTSIFFEEARRAEIISKDRSR